MTTDVRVLHLNDAINPGKAEEKLMTLDVCGEAKVSQYFSYI